MIGIVTNMAKASFLYASVSLKGINVHKPQLHKPDLHKPDINMPDLHVPELHKPDIKMPDLHKPDLHKPDIHISKPEIDIDMDINISEDIVIDPEMVMNVGKTVAALTGH